MADEVQQDSENLTCPTCGGHLQRRFTGERSTAAPEQFEFELWCPACTKREANEVYMAAQKRLADAGYFTGGGS